MAGLCDLMYLGHLMCWGFLQYCVFSEQSDDRRPQCRARDYWIMNIKQQKTILTNKFVNLELTSKQTDFGYSWTSASLLFTQLPLTKLKEFASLYIHVSWIQVAHNTLLYPCTGQKPRIKLIFMTKVKVVACHLIILQCLSISFLPVCYMPPLSSHFPPH